MAHDTYYHSFDGETLYRELSNYKAYLQECKEDAETEGEYNEITDELDRVCCTMENLNKWFDCE